MRVRMSSGGRFRLVRSTRRGTGRADDVRCDMEAGAAAVEMALVLPLLVMLLFAIIQFGIIFAQELGIGNGAREGARFAASTPSITCSQLTTKVRQASTTVLVAPLDVSVQVSRGSDPVGATAACGAPTNKPCDGSADGDNIYVRTAFDGELFIPFVISRPTFPLEGNGGFACEFS